MTTGTGSPIDTGVLAHIPGRIKPTAHRNWWIFVGLVLQLAGIGTPAAYVWTKAKHQDVGGLITVSTIKLTWHDSLHSKSGLAILVGGAVLFALGSMAIARPFAKHWVTLLVGVPVAALFGALVLGVAALVIALVVLLFSDGGDIGGFGGGGGGGKKKKDEAEQVSGLADQAG